MHNGSSTHAVFNQTPPLTDYNLYTSDAALQEAVRREGAACAPAELDAPAPRSALPRTSSMRGSPIAIHPCCRTSTSRGERIDAIEFHPSWHALMQGIAARGYHSSPWATREADPRQRRARMRRALRAI